MKKRPVMLIILDGLGIREAEEGNAVKLARMPHYNQWLKTLERSVIDASEEFVGLVRGQMGNSEVGHMNLGAGRVVYQDISRVDVAIQDGSLRADPTLQAALAHVKERGSKLHLIGLVSDGGVHSHQRHLYALLRIAREQQVDPVVHVITDGRDTPPESGADFVRELEAVITKEGVGRIATVCGRYYAMDRDKRWERTLKAYNAIAFRQAENRANSPVEALEQSYAVNVTDEFVEPTLIGSDETLKIEPGDALLFYNFRADRMRQIVQTFARKRVEGFTGQHIPDLHLVTFTEYMDDLPAQVIFGKDNLENTLAEVLSKAGLKQYHSAETEKYPHVTFFFNGRREEPFPGEERRMVPSPKVATYDLKPEMSAYELADATLERITQHDDDFILVNFANPDMVGHTGSLEAAIKAVETVDECANKLVEAILKKGGVAIVTADHGNCERMVEIATGQPHTYHTTNPVSLFVIGAGYYRLCPRGKLADVAPTALDLLGVEKPEEMTGFSLIDAWVAPEEMNLR